MRTSKVILIGLICGLLIYAVLAPYAYFERGRRFDVGGECLTAVTVAVMLPLFIKEHETKKATKRRSARERAGRRYKEW